MEELGLLNDESFARDYARELFSRKKFGSRRVRMELSLKGIDSALIDELLAEYADEEAETENVLSVLQRRYGGWEEDEKIRRRAVAALQRLGYSYEQIRRAMSLSGEEEQGL